MTRFWDWFWAAWFMLFVVTDITLAVTKHQQYTLSWRIWAAEGGWSAVHFAVAAFLLWAVLHLVFRLFP